MSFRAASCWSADGPIAAVLFDLDDTLYPQSAWLDGAWQRVAETATACGINGGALLRALHDVAAHGSDRGRIIDRALERIGARGAPVRLLVSAFRAHEARHLALYPGVRPALDEIRSLVPVAVVTDGDPEIQRSKLRSLGLTDAFDAVVISDECGRARRKPDPHALLLAASRLGVEPGACAYIGDRPGKDVAAARAAGMRSVRVRTGEYASVPDVPRAWLQVPDVATAVARLAPLLSGSATGSAARRWRGR
jgi:putative hydrolase of the HAD superfamily